jgi:lactate 2-monooxygenase
VQRYPGAGFVKKARSGMPVKAVQKFINVYSNPKITWNDLSFFRKVTSLPIILKGILHADDARKAIDYGVDGVIVSNHGGRQVDGAIAALDALPAVAAAIDKRIPIIMDSGVRGGADVFKALALGANAVGIGRPYVYGLALRGQLGVSEVFSNIMAEFELTMGLSGCANISEIGAGNVLEKARLI